MGWDRTGAGCMRVRVGWDRAGAGCMFWLGWAGIGQVQGYMWVRLGWDREGAGCMWVRVGMGRARIVTKITQPDCKHILKSFLKLYEM